jgi:Ca-activated chloride channel homolog
MKIMMNFFIGVLFFTSFSLYSFSYDTAAYAAQNGKWKDAHEKLNNILVDSPDRADVLYDAGVAAYNLKNYTEAAACFSRAAECTDDKKLRTNSYFNAGNALVDAQDLTVALDCYEKVLALDSAHEYARHNRDRVKQMLEEEKNKQEQQGDDEKKDDQKNDDQKDEQEQNDQQNEKNDQQNQSQNDKQDQQGNDKQQQGGQSDSSEDGSDKESKGDQGDDAERGSNNAQRKDHGNKEKNQNKSADQQKRDSDQQLKEKSDDKNSKSDTKQGDKHKKSPEKQLNNSDNASVPSQEGQEQDKKGDLSAEALAEEDAGAQQEDMQKSFEQKIQDPWLLSVLNNQEERDKVMNKLLMETKINQHGGKDGQNCW